jgi:hypothetical protein
VFRPPSFSLLANTTEPQFVVDGTWTTDHTAAQEKDSSGNLNNILLPSDITPSGAAHILSTVTPAATTAALAGAVPKESDKKDIPGGFPETPGTEPQTISVNPIPATSGIGNPIHLEPGEKVPDPSKLTPNTVESTAKTDQASYEKSDAAVTTGGEVKPAETGGGMFGVPPVTSNMIPESSLPIGTSTGGSGESDPGVTIQSVAPTSTTVALAGAVPKEELPADVPEVVKESERAANASPEAAANPEAVQEKSEVERELKAKVPEEPPTSTDTGIAGAVTGGLAAAGAAAASAAAYAHSKLPEQAQNVIDGLASKLSGTTPHETTTMSEVPAVVIESIAKAQEPAEAAANPEAVKEKGQMEQELEAKVKPVDAAGEPAPTVTAETSAVAPGDKPPASTEEPMPSSEEAKEKEQGNAVSPPPLKSEDVSPKTATTPAATAGAPVEAKSEGDAATASTTSTPKKADTPSSSTAPTPDKSEKKKKRFNFLRKLKESFK